MSRPNRHGFVPHSQPRPNHSFDNQGADARSYDSQPGVRGGPHGHSTVGHGIPDTYGGHYVNHPGPPLPPQRENPLSRRRTESGEQASLSSGQNEFDFSGFHVSQASNYQTDPTYHGNAQGIELSRPQDYYRARHAGDQWSSSNSGYQGYPMDQDVLPPSGMSRRGMRRDTSVLRPQGQPQQADPSQLLYGYGSSPAQASFWNPGPDGQALYNSPSPSSSSDGSPFIKPDPAGSTVSLSPEGMPKYMEVEDYLRKELQIPFPQPVCLSSLPDPPPGTRPSLTYKLLASLAIIGSRHQRLSLQEIYERIEERFPWYRNQTEEEKKKWQGSLRHNLSLECIFQHSGRPIAEPGKGGYWMLTNRNGYGQKRLRKRRGKGTNAIAIKTEEEEDQLEMSDDSFNSAYPDDPQVGSWSGNQRTTNMSSVSDLPVFGQPSFPPPASGPMRMQSLPAVASLSGGHELSPRPATFPTSGMHRYRSGREHGQYQDAMDVNEDPRRTRYSRRSYREEYD